MVLPLGLVVIASFLMIETSFLLPGDSKASSGSIWYQEDSDISAIRGSRRLRLAIQIALDIAVWLPVTMPIYGIIPAVMAYWNCLRRGNIFDFRSAAKGANKSGETLQTQEADVVGRANVDQLDAIF